MTINNFAQIAINTKMVNNINSFTYSIPKDIQNSIMIGSLVCINFKNKQTQGVVLNLHNNKPTFKVKPIDSIIYKEPIINPIQMHLIDEMVTRYRTDYMSAIRLFTNFELPVILNRETIKFNKSDINLTSEQSNAIKEIKESKQKRFLIHGVTDSGKTEIYIRLAMDYISKGKQVLILVPQISLTPQVTEKFENIFGKENIKIYHSKINNYKNNIDSSIPIVIGTRSALFYPFTNLGLIIIDESHDLSYKQENNPRYNAITMAEKLSTITDSKLVLGSATPLVEQYKRGLDKDYEIISLPNTIHKNQNITIKIIDLTKENTKRDIFSKELLDSIELRLQRNEQSIIYYNRRGVASCIICNNCKNTIKCTNCDLSMTLHKDFLLCHHCGYKISIPKDCPTCHSNFLSPIGYGTQSIEKQLLTHFPFSNIIRLDKDSINSTNNLNNIYKAIKNNEINIIVGTQIISKGWDISNVTLVGIPDLDTELIFPDFRSGEQAYETINQVIGRGGRNNKDTEIIIQTNNPDNKILSNAIKSDFNSFYNDEIIKRKKLNYPPFSELIKITVKDKNLDKCKQNIVTLYNQLANNTKGDNNIILYKPIPSFYYFVRRNYQLQILIKLLNNNYNLDKIFKGINSTNNIIIDTEPFSLL